MRIFNAKIHKNYQKFEYIRPKGNIDARIHTTYQEVPDIRQKGLY
jgi:hypothetical protein